MSDLITEAKIMLAQYDGRNRNPGLAQSEHDLARALRKAANALEAAEAGGLKLFQENYGLAGERDEAEAKLARVEALHQPWNRGGGNVVCIHCKQNTSPMPEPEPWPCPTAQAIRGEER